MPVTTRIALKDFNSEKFHEELGAASIPGQVSWAGFDPLTSRIWTPCAEATKYQGTSSQFGDVFAPRGELWLNSPEELTPAQDASLDAVLTAHNSATLTAEQSRRDQDETDIVSLRDIDLPIVQGHIQAWDTKSSTQKFVAMKDIAQALRKTMRVFIRTNRGGSI